MMMFSVKARTSDLAVNFFCTKSDAVCQQVRFEPRKKNRRLYQERLIFKSGLGVSLERQSRQRDRRGNETGRQLQHDIEVVRSARGVVRALWNAEALADAALKLHVGGAKDIAELLLLSFEFDDRHGPLSPGPGGRGLGRLTIRIDLDRQVHGAQQGRGGHAHHAGAEHGDIVGSGSNQVLLDDVAHLGRATPTQGDAGTAVSVIVYNELAGGHLRVEPIGVVAIGSHAGNASTRCIWVKRKVGCW
jgi:hypothetical protein